MRPHLVAVLFMFGWTVPASAQFLGKNAGDWTGELGNPQVQARRSAAYALGKLGSQANGSIPRLLEVLSNDSSPEVREAAAFALGEIVAQSLNARDDPRLAGTLAAALAGDKSERVRRSAAIALGSLGRHGGQVLPQLVKSLDDKSSIVRQNVAWALGKYGTDAIPGLRKALRDGDPLVQRDAATSLGGLPSVDVRDALPELLDVCQTPNAETQQAALHVLANVVAPSDAGRVGPLRAALRDKNQLVRLDAALVLANVGGQVAKPAVPVLVEALRQGNVETRRQAAAALRNIGPDAVDAVADLMQALKDSDDQTRGNAAMALGGIGAAAERAYPHIARMLADSKETITNRVEAAVALSRIGRCPAAIDAVPTLLSVLGDPSEDRRVRERVVWALRVHGSHLRRMNNIYPTFEKVIGEPKSDELRMLRYDCAYMLGMLQGSSVSERAMDTLDEFLKDPTIQIFVNKKATVGTANENNTGTVDVQELGKGDGRVMVLQAFKQIGARRVGRYAGIVRQLRVLANDRETLPDLRTACQDYLKEL